MIRLAHLYTACGAASSAPTFLGNLHERKVDLETSREGCHRDGWRGDIGRCEALLLAQQDARVVIADLESSGPETNLTESNSLYKRT